MKPEYTQLAEFAEARHGILDVDLTQGGKLVDRKPQPMIDLPQTHCPEDRLALPGFNQNSLGANCASHCKRPS